MLAFPVIALAIALIAIGRGGDKLLLEERKRDRIARRVMLILGILVLVAWLAILLL